MATPLNTPQTPYTDTVFVSGCCMPGVWIKDAGYSPFVHLINNQAVLNLNLESFNTIDHMLSLEDLLKSNTSLQSVKVNATRKIATIAWDIKNPINIGTFLDDLKQQNFPVLPFLPDENGDVLEKKLMRALVVAIFGTINVMMLSISIWMGNVQNMDDTTRSLFHFISAIITVPIASYAGIPFFKGALHHIGKRQSGMDVPISLAIIISVILSLIQTFKGAEVAYYDSTLMLLVFLLLGRYLDVRARRKARDSAIRMLSMQARIVTQYKDKKSIMTPIEDISIGDTIIVHAGQNIPMDGVITQGRSTINSALMTGESIPQSVNINSHVLAGTTNLMGVLHIKVTALADKSVLAKMMDILQNTQNYRSDFTRFGDKIAKYYAPVIYISSIGAYIYHSIYSSQSIDSLEIALAVLIIACPCALAIAVPGVQAVCTGTLFNAGVLVKDGSAIERLSAVDTFVFDKTGTLTQGTPTLQKGTYSNDDLYIASSLAHYSNHPLSLALNQAYSGDKSLMKFTNVCEIAGTGITGTYNKKVYKLGSADFVGGTAVNSTQVWLGYPNGDAVCFTFADTVKPQAKQICSALHALGINTILLSGDVQSEADKIANATGIKTAYGKCNPLQKVDIIKKLQSNGSNICMVGDGINDAPALSIANASIIPKNGSDIAQSTGDFALRHEDISIIMTLHSICIKAQRIIKTNIAFSIGYNILAIPLAFFGFVSPLVAALSMSFSSLIVVLNALRLRKID